MVANAATGDTIIEGTPRRRAEEWVTEGRATVTRCDDLSESHCTGRTFEFFHGYRAGRSASSASLICFRLTFSNPNVGISFCIMSLISPERMRLLFWTDRKSVV